MEALGNTLMAVAFGGALLYSVMSLCGYVCGEVKDAIRTIIREEINRV